MKKNLRILAGLLACLMVVCMAAGCKPSGDGEDTEPPAPSVEGLVVGDAMLQDFTIVTPAEADITEQRAAEFLKSYLQSTYGFDVPLVTDETAAAAHEILVGATARTPAAVVSASYEKMQFAACTDGGNIVLYGPEMMSAGAVSELIYHVLAGQKDLDVGAALGTSAAPKTYEFTATTDSVILIVGDGHSYNHYKIAVQNGDLESFVGFSFPALGYAVTNSETGTTDSAAGGTAFATGFKTYNGAIAMDRYGNALYSLGELAKKHNMKVAFLTDCDIADATPAVFYAHLNERFEFDPIYPMLDAFGADVAKGDLDYTQLAETMMETIYQISPNGEPFFIMTENGLFDTASHGSHTNGIRNAAVEMDEMLREAAAYVFMHPNVQLIVTADHETGGLGDAYPLNVPEYPDVPMNTFHTEGSHSSRTVPLLLLGRDVEKFNNEVIENTDTAHYIASLLGENDFGYTGMTGNDATPSMLPTIVSEGHTADGFTYSLRSDGAAVITGTADETVASLVIPAALDGHTVVAIGASAFSGCTALGEVTFPETVVSVGGKAFENTPYLASLTEEEFVIVGGGVLLKYNGEELEVTVPDGVVSICGAFADKATMTTVHLPASLREIGDDAFSGCRRLLNVEMPEGLLSIGERAFYGCRFLKTLVFPESLDSIGAYAFYSCEKLKNITFPQEMHTLGEFAFFYCPALGSVEPPEGLTEIPESCFAMCQGIYNAHLPSTLKVLGKNAFQHCEQLNAVDLNQGLLSIGEGAFQSTRLMNIQLPNTLETIGENAFAGLEYPYAITVPASVTSVGASAFSGMSRVMAVVWRAACAIPENCFGGFESLALIELTSACTGIAENAFSGAPAAQQLIFEGTEAALQTLLSAVSAGNEAVTAAETVVYAGPEALPLY